MILHTFNNATSRIEACLNQLQAWVNAILINQANVTIAISGGKSPIALFEAISMSNLNFSKITFTLVDERIVDTSHIDSNEKLVRTYLLKNYAKDAKFVGLIDNESLVKHQIPYYLHKNKFPIDIAILGMGEDGHTASIFPDCPEINQALQEKNIHNYIITHPHIASHVRIGLNLQGIIKIPHLLLNINGIVKHNILCKACIQETPDVPISSLLLQRTDITVFWSKL